MTAYYAHTLEDKAAKDWQLLEDHLQAVAALAKHFAEDFGGEDWAYLAGLWHDLGKYSAEFQKRIGALGDPEASAESRGTKPDHSTAGSKHAVCRLKDPGKLLAYAIAGHHAGLPDGRSNETGCLTRRLKKPIPDYSAAPSWLLEKKLHQTSPPFQLERNRMGIQLSFFVRMLYSCLVDADFLDTEAFMDKKRAAWRKGYPDLALLEKRLSVYLNQLTQKAEPTPINARRQEILAHCMKAAQQPGGIFSLTVPTGGGKTLSSLAFALKHALAHGLKRVIYVIPYTSIIEQNAQVFRDVLGEESVLEHHSNFEPKAEDRHSRLAAENWDAPLIVTTNVQFFESLFHNRSSRCRKLHHIAKSVVILDEAQMLPPRLLLPCIEALRELSSVYHSTVVLCTATQPALFKHNGFRWGLEARDPEIIPDPRSLYQEFKRVEVNYLKTISDSELSRRLSEHDQALCVVNSRKHARQIFQLLKGETGVFHLSALMCPAHRTQKLARIKATLKNGDSCRVVSTSLIEAGVDIDFPVVYRAASGIDSVAQAAGRCNREGKLSAPGRVYVFVPESGLPASDLRQQSQTAEIVIRNYKDFLSLEAVEQYFENLYWIKGEKRLDAEGILLDLRTGVAKNGNIPFKTLAQKFKLIKQEMESLIIPWDAEAETYIENLRFSNNPGYYARKLQRYTVQIYAGEFSDLNTPENLENLGHGGQFHVLRNMELYGDDLGLCTQPPDSIDPVKLIC